MQAIPATEGRNILSRLKRRNRRKRKAKKSKKARRLKNKILAELTAKFKNKKKAVGTTIQPLFSIKGLSLNYLTFGP